MPVLPNTRHERFAQELAKGNSQTEAYTLAGYRPSEQHASRLATNGKVRARVSELQQKSVERTLITLESITAELEAARIMAMSRPEGASAAVAASLGKAKLHGLIVERAESLNYNYTISDSPPSAEEWQERYGDQAAATH